MARRFFQQAKHITKEDSCLETDYGPLSFLLIRSSGRRSMCITVTQRAAVEIAVPASCPQRTVEEFIHKKAKWIFGKIEEARKNQGILESRRFISGREFLFLGKNFPLNVHEKEDVGRPFVGFDGAAWQAYLPKGVDGETAEDMVRQKMIQWYREQAEEILGGRTFHYSRIMDLYPEKIAVRSFKRVWGNCDYHTKTLQYNWQIVQSPIPVIDYVIVHELCHLVHPNHGSRFWKKVERFMPDFRDHRQWLRQHHASITLT